jgi:hypothetical protein
MTRSSHIDFNLIFFVIIIIKIQEKDYDLVISCLSAHIPKIYDESLSLDDEIVYVRKKGKSYFSNKNLPISPNLVANTELQQTICSNRIISNEINTSN